MRLPAGVDLDPYIPGVLQSRLREASGRLQGERRPVTFLFADLVGSTALSEKVDLELLKLIMDRVVGVMVEGVVEYEGMVAQVSGDGLLAFFGAPLAHEDDSERALHSALTIQEKLGELSKDLEQAYGVPVLARIGINAGEVIIGEMRSDLRLEYVARGPAINLAARLEAAAPPGAILVGEEVYGETHASFEFGEAVSLELKGWSEPMVAYRPLRARPGLRRKRDLERAEALLVGRDPELAQLDQVLGEIRTGRGQIILVLGEAGIGKSRLVLEARKRSAEGVRWAEGHCLSFATNHTFHPFVDALRDLASIEPADPATVASLKLTRFLSGLPAEERKRHEPLLATLLGLPLDKRSEAEVQLLSPQATLQRLAAAISAILARLCDETPVALFLDDLHWADRPSVELLEQVLPVVESSPVLIALAMRPDRDSSAWQLLGPIHSTYFNRRVEIDLTPLPETAAGDLLEGLIPLANLPQRVRDLILQKSEGNPFSMEELVRSLLQSGAIARRNGGWVMAEEIEDMEVPDTVHRVILSRLDRLPADERRLLQAASVLGRHFSPAVLENVAETPVDEALLALTRTDFVQERSRAPERHYMFKHWLTQEAVYSTLLESDQRELHARALEALESAGASSAELARHAHAAGLAERAYLLSLAAGDDAMRLLSTQEALSHYRRARSLAEQLERPDMLFEAHARSGKAHMRVTNYADARTDLEKALSYPADEERRADALIELLDAVFWSLDIPGVLRYSDEARGIAKRLGRGDLESACIAWRGAAHGADGDLPRAVTTFEQAATLARQSGARLPPPAHPIHCIALYWMGRLKEAIEVGREAVQTARDANHAGAVTFAYSNLGLSLAGQGRYREAIQVFDEGQHFALEYGVQSQRARLMAVATGFRVDLGDYAGADASAGEARELAMSLAFPPAGVSAGIDLLVNDARRGEVGRTEELLPWVAEMSAKAAGFHGWLWRMRLLDARAEIAAARGEWDDALAHARKALEESRPRPRPKYAVRALHTCARALQGLGRTKEALRALQDALSLVREMPDPVLRLRVLADLLALEGDETLAAEARECLGGIRAELPEDALSTAFEASEPVRTVLRLAGALATDV